MTRNSFLALIGLRAVAFTGPTMTPAQADLIDRKGTTIVEARNAMKAVEEATKRGWKLVIAIIDDGARLMTLKRMDGAPSSRVDVAKKACTAAAGIVAIKRADAPT